MKHSDEIRKLRQSLPEILTPAEQGLVWVPRPTRASAFDWSQTSGLTADGAWHDLSLASKVTDSDAVMVRFKRGLACTAAGRFLGLRLNGITYGYDNYGIVTQAASIQVEGTFDVECDSSQVIEYTLPATGLSSFFLVIQGWWRDPS